MSAVYLAASDRFRQERQILTELEHPHIAGLLRWRYYPGRRPYLVLEYVDDVAPTTFAKALPLQSSCALFATV